MSPSDAAPAIPPDVLIAHAQFVRRVAWAILRDDADADDAAQETLARGLVAGPVEPRARSSWLATVAQNVARRLRRGESRSAARDRTVARPEATSSALDHAIRAETIRSVAEAVVALDEPMRSAVILRHYDGLAPREIAVRTGDSIAAVKKRLQRAHERLRARLASQRPGGGDRWRQALAGFAGISLDGASGGPASSWSAVGSSAARAVTGGLAMGTTAKVGLAAAAVLLLGVGGWWAFGREGDERPAGSPTAPPMNESAAEPALRSPTLAAQGTKPTHAESAAATGAPTAATEAAPAAEPTDEQLAALAVATPGEVLEGVVLDARGPVAGVAIDAKPLNISAVRGEKAHREGRKPPMGGARTGDDGVFRIVDAWANVSLVTLRAEGATTRSFRVSDGSNTEPARVRSVIVLGDGVVEGTVSDHAGAPASARAVQLSRMLVMVRDHDGKLARPRVAETLETQSATDGAFRFTRVPSGNWTLTADLDVSDPNRPDRLEAIRYLKPGEVARVDLGARSTDAIWTGSVRLSSGTAVRAAAMLHLQDVEQGPIATVRVGEGGHVSQRLRAGTYRLIMLDGRRFANSEPPELVVGATDFEKDLVIPGVRVAGMIRDLAPVPASALRLSRRFGIKIRSVPPEPRTLPMIGADHKKEDGSFEILGLPAGRWRITVESDAFGSEGPRVPAEQEIVVTDRDIDGLVFEMRKP